MTDLGKEYTAKSVQDFLKKNNVHWYHTFSGVKASISERHIRTFREKLQKIFHHRGNYRYIDILQKLADSYNNRVHSSTKIAPVNVSSKNEQEIFYRL